MTRNKLLSIIADVTDTIGDLRSKLFHAVMTEDEAKKTLNAQHRLEGRRARLIVRMEKGEK